MIRSALLLVLLAGCAPIQKDPSVPFRVSAFQCDATIPIGHPTAGKKPAEIIEEPLLLKGIVLESGDSRFVVAAIDWCTMGTRTYETLRRSLAAAVETKSDFVTVHCTHTHSGPSGNPEAGFLDQVAARAADAARAALPRLRQVTHVGMGQAEVRDFASNRRVPGPDGKILVRYSATKDAALRAQPRGLVDPFLRTVTLLDGTTPLVRMHYYATHPQSYYGDGRVHPDTPGWARSRLEKEEGIPHLYFTGGAGNVTAGKYNDGSPEARAGLIDRLADGMRRSIAATTVEAFDHLQWKTQSVRLVRKEDGSDWDLIHLIRLTLGSAEIVHLPGEPFVEYQLHAAAARPGGFVAVAGYGDGGPGYICVDKALEEGGYEPTASKVGPPTESRLRKAIDDLLADPHALRMATFQSDATPPIGHRLVGWSVLMKSVEAPLLLKGILLGDGRTRYVLAALDWCRLQTGAYDLFRRKLAQAALIPESQVAIHCTHTHGAPIADSDAQRLLDSHPGAPVHLDLAFLEQVTDRAARSLAEALPKLRPFTHVGFGKARVEEFASNRRIPAADGKVKSRMSSCKDPALVAAPEGTIDPWLRTVTLFDGPVPLVRMHYYATHPQSHYGTEGSPDVPGFARARLEKEEGIPHLYFTGCGGNVAAGKYNDGSPEARTRLVDRLATAMRSAIASTHRASARLLEWKTVGMEFALRTEPAFSEEQFRRDLADPKAPDLARLKAALALAWVDRLKAGPKVECSRLRIGPVTLLHLPGEAFVEYQLYAQSLLPDAFIAVAAYGEGGPGYICMDGSAAEGGYEPTASYVGPPTESRFKAAIAELMK